MWYYVYRYIASTETDKAVVQELGRTRYQEDAEALLSRWHSGYISHRGQFVVEKNMDGV